jgi:CRISPR/Cas system-associated exonuclease Cas4 (RecB family)
LPTTDFIDIGNQQVPYPKLNNIVLSYSSLTSFLGCQRRFLYSKILGLKPAPTNDFHAYLGTFIQYQLEQLTNKKIFKHVSCDKFMTDVENSLMKSILDTTYPMGGEKRDVKSAYFKEMGCHSIDFKEHTVDEIHENLTKLLLPNIALYWKDGILGDLNNIVCEEYIEFNKVTPNNKKYTIRGYIDFKIKGKNGISIMDGKKKYNPKFHKTHQIGIYALALESQGVSKLKEDFGFWSYTTGKITNVEVKPQETLEWMNNTVDFIYQALETKNFSKNTSDCKFCSYKEVCKNHKEEVRIEI